MNKNEVAALLARVDNYLERVPVSGEGVFVLAEARRTLKRAYDLASEPEHEYIAEGGKPHGATSAGNNADDHHDIQDG